MFNKPLLCSVIFLVLVLCPLKLNAQYKVDNEIEAIGRFHDFSDDFKESRNHFLEQYTSYRGYFGDNLDKFFYDLSNLDLHVTRDIKNTDLFNLQRSSVNYRNQRNSFTFDLDGIRLDGKLGFYRSNTLEIVPVPDSSYAIAGNSASGYGSKFNDDSGDFKRFYKQRLPYSLNLSVKPSSLGLETGWLEKINLKYKGYLRDGERFSTYLLSSKDVNGAGDSLIRTQERWRGFKQEINKNVDRISTTFVLTPDDETVINLDFAFEHFSNKSSETTLGDIARISGLPLMPDNTGAVGFSSANSKKSLFYVPDTNKLFGGINFKRKFFKKLFVRGSYKTSFLDQRSFTTLEKENGFGTRQVFNQFVNFQTSYKLLKNLDWGVFTRYANRNNVSEWETGIFTRSGLSSPRIAGIDNLFFGTNFTYRASFLSSVLNFGYEREETNRELNFNQTQIVKNETTYDEDTGINKIFLKTHFRPYKNLTARANASFRFASQTGLLTEPDTEEKVKLSLNYYNPKILQGLHISPFYQVRIARSGLFALTSPTTSNDWKRDDFLQSAGATISLAATRKLNFILSYFWNDDNVDTNYIRTTRRKYNATAFVGKDAGRSDYDVHKQNIRSLKYDFVEQI